MRWRGWIMLAIVPLGACAPDIVAYSPALDPDLVTPLTQTHLAHCRAVVAALPQPTIWGTIAGQVGSSSGNSWVQAAELGTATAAETAAGATIVGTLLGTHSGLTSRQEAAESSVRSCMANYHEPILEKP
jgi:hypothetical protein